jgi:hypothetical protein
MILPFIFMGLFIGFTGHESGITDLEKCHLKGNVKSVMETRYALSDSGKNSTREKIIYQRSTAFDVNGSETGTTLFKEGEEFLKSKYTFGADDKQVEMHEYHPDGTLNLVVTYKYDEKGFRTESLYDWTENRQIGEFAENTDFYYEIINNDIFTRVVHKNEYRGYCIEEEYLKADGGLSFKFTYKYDFRGNILESGYYHGNGRLSWMTKYKYDRYDNMIESRIFKSNRIAVHSEYSYQFDFIGNWIIRNEKREVFENILTAGLDKNNTVTERMIEYY